MSAENQNEPKKWFKPDVVFFLARAAKSYYTQQYRKHAANAWDIQERMKVWVEQHPGEDVEEETAFMVSLRIEQSRMKELEDWFKKSIEEIAARDPYQQGVDKLLSINLDI